MSAETVLSLHSFGVAFGDRVILSAVDLALPARGVTVLLGPAGTGKSTLLRTLAGFNAANPSHRSWGEALYSGRALGSGDMPALLMQSARLMMSSVRENIIGGMPGRDSLSRADQNELCGHLLHEAGLPELAQRLDEPAVQLSLAMQRHLAVVRLAAGDPPLLCADEPTTGLDDADCSRFLAHLRRESQRRAVFVVLHNQRHARELGGEAALLAGGCIQEHAPVEVLLGAPRSAAAQQFARTGSCSVPSPNAEPEELEDDAVRSTPPPRAALTAVSASRGPRGFLWLEKGRLAGTPMPGVVYDIEHDLQALQRVGITHLVTLTEAPLDQARLDRYGLHCRWEPIPDMQAPTVERCMRLCQDIGELVALGAVIAVHCRAGLGRTGTILAAYLIYRGSSALQALESVRRIEPRWVQSQEQVRFLEVFAEALRPRVDATFVSRRTIFEEST